MEKKLPKVFAGKFDHKIDNNEEVFYSNVTEESMEKAENRSNNDKTIRQKLSDIFSSTNYVYKAKVKIELPSGIVEKSIVGKNDHFLITMDNEKIPLDDIKDIWIQK